jgi:hypothetical protein
MRALTIRQPWAGLIMAGIKTVENRTWQTKHRGLLVVHAGRIDRQPMAEHGHLLGTSPVVTGAIIGTVRVVGCVRDADSRWAIDGNWHWLLADPQPLAEPIACPGRLGLWQVPAELEHHLVQTTEAGR